MRKYEPHQRILVTGGAGFLGPINLGNLGEFTIKQLTEKVIELTGSASKLIYQPLPADDPLQRQPNISRAQEKLNHWQPQVQLQAGLQRTIAYLDQLLSKQALTPCAA